ncbi:MAG: PQ-loop domain-containing transporter [Luteolibacter sp.]
MDILHSHLIPTANVAESLVPLLVLVAYIPQWRHLWRTRYSRSISLSSWAIWAVAYLISVFYAAVLLHTR